MYIISAIIILAAKQLLMTPWQQMVLGTYARKVICSLHLLVTWVCKGHSTPGGRGFGRDWRRRRDWVRIPTSTFDWSADSISFDGNTLPVTELDADKVCQQAVTPLGADDQLKTTMRFSFIYVILPDPTSLRPPQVACAGHGVVEECLSWECNTPSGQVVGQVLHLHSKVNSTFHSTSGNAND